MKKILTVIMLILFVFSVCGCTTVKDISDYVVNEEAKPKTFEYDGISIELTTDFLRMDFLDEEYEFVIGDGDLVIMGEKYLNSETELGDFTVQEFAEYHRFLLKNINPTEISDVDGIPTMKYTTTNDDGEEITAALMYYKSEDCFWVLTFAIESDEFLEENIEINKYAKSVNVK